MAYIAASRVRNTTEPRAIAAPHCFRTGYSEIEDANASPGRDKLEQHAARERTCARSDAQQAVRIIHDRAVERSPRDARRGGDDEQPAGAEGCSAVRAHALPPLGASPAHDHRYPKRPDEADARARSTPTSVGGTLFSHR